MAQPRPRRQPREIAPLDDPGHPDYMHPAEERRLRLELLRRIDHLCGIKARKLHRMGRREEARLLLAELPPDQAFIPDS